MFFLAGSNPKKLHNIAFLMAIMEVDLIAHAGKHCYEEVLPFNSWHRFHGEDRLLTKVDLIAHSGKHCFEEVLPFNSSHGFHGEEHY
mgnify:FL=1